MKRHDYVYVLVPQPGIIPMKTRAKGATSHKKLCSGGVVAMRVHSIRKVAVV